MVPLGGAKTAEAAEIMAPETSVASRCHGNEAAPPFDISHAFFPRSLPYGNAWLGRALRLSFFFIMPDFNQDNCAPRLPSVPFGGCPDGLAVQIDRVRHRRPATEITRLSFVSGPEWANGGPVGRLGDISVLSLLWVS